MECSIRTTYRQDHYQACVIRVLRGFPIHVSQTFAEYANLPGTVSHGMYTPAAGRRITGSWIVDEETQRFKRWSAGFTGMCLPSKKVHVKLSLVSIQGRNFVETTALNDRF